MDSTISVGRVVEQDDRAGEGVGVGCGCWSQHRIFQRLKTVLTFFSSFLFLLPSAAPVSFFLFTMIFDNGCW